MRRLRPGLIVAGVLLALSVAMFAPQVFGGRSLIPYDALLADPAFREALSDQGIRRPQNGLVADLVYQNLIWKDFLSESIADGEAPLWNPYLFGGIPFFAAAQHGALSPPTWIQVGLGPDVGFTVAAVLLLWWAGMGAYLLGRALGVKREAALLAATGWCLSTLFMANTVFPMIQGAMAWTPFLLVAITRLTGSATPRGILPTGRTAGWVVAAAISTTMIALSGHIEMLYYAALVAVAWTTFRVARLGRASGRTAAIGALLWILASAVIGGLIAGVQLVPLWELARTNFRVGGSYEDTVQHAFGLRQIITFLVPDFYGNPAHHAVFSLSEWRRIALEDHTMWGTRWGAKNYVEAAGYIGLLPLLLAPIAWFHPRRRPATAFFTGLAVVSIALAFGTPLYRLVFALPGMDQLRTPFRWVFPYAMSVAALAAIGADAVLSDRPRWRRCRRAARAIGGTAIGIGVWIGFVLSLAFAFPERWTAATDALLRRLPGARQPAVETFGGIEWFAAYQYWNALHLAVFLTLSGVALIWMAAQNNPALRRRGLVVALAALAMDVGLIGFGFNPAVDPALRAVEPAPITFLAESGDVKWGRTVGFGDDKVLWPNTPMRFGIRDIRGYDSIIPWWTTETLSAIDDQAGWLPFNRIGNLDDIDALSHPALLALGGRYVVTRDDLAGTDLRQIFDGEVRIYENVAAMPRAWVVNEVRVVQDRDALLDDLASFDPRSEVLLEREPDLDVWELVERGRQMFQPSIEVRSDAHNGFELDVFANAPGMLVLSEGYFPGWRAWVTTSTGGGPVETEVPVYRANGMLRAIPIPAGRMTVEMRYFPMSVKAGMYVSFLGLIVLLLIAVYALWKRYVRIDARDGARRVAINSAGPIAAALLNKVLLFVFAMLYLRVLGPEDAGKYYLAITLYTLADIITNFGLNLLVAREVARRPSDASSLLANSIALRLLLWVLVLPLLAVYGWAQSALGDPLDTDTLAAIALLAVALIPANLNTALSSVFQGMERMVLPAVVTIGSTLLTVSLGALALLAGWGFVGLAGAAIITNWLTFLVLGALAIRDGIWPFAAVSATVLAWMSRESLPLMLNHLLQVVFFKVDVLLLKPMKGDLVVGWYQSAYKWLDALLIIPSYLTMALFPLMSRRAEGDRAGLRQAYVGTIRWLVAVALPIAVLTTYLADPLIRLLGGPEYLPQGAQALQIMIWFLPFSFVNGVTQYVLIAMNRQRWITLSFAVAATFNLVVNVAVIPTYGYVGAAAVTIASEIILMVPFFYGLRDLEAPPLLVLAWRPLLGASAMALVLSAAESVGLLSVAGAPAAAIVYVAALHLMGWLNEDDRRIIRRLVSGAPTPSERAEVEPAVTS